MKKQTPAWGGKRRGAGRLVRHLFTRRAAAVILDLADSQSAGTPQDAQAYDSNVDRAAKIKGLMDKIERLGGIDKASEIAAEEYPDLI